MSVLGGQDFPATNNNPTSHAHEASLKLSSVISKTLQCPPAIDPHGSARAVVRLVQCTQCSLPLQNPLTLPCGNSLCRKCVPQQHHREHISYPNIASRQEAFTCPFSECRNSHTLGDCSQDVTLSKVLEKVNVEMARVRPLSIDTPTLLDERPHWKNIIDSSKEERYPSSRILNGGRLLATYALAELGELRHDSEVAYQTMSPTGDTYEDMDHAMLNHLKDATRTELDCQVCYALLLDPLTTNCGHTFCRKCVARVLDHSTLCPICRRTLPMPSGVRELPGNRLLSKLLSDLCPDLVQAREEAAAQEDEALFGEKNIPFFVCTLAYPEMPTFLHIFEPRYRLMTRRAVESGDRKFGMLMYNRRGSPQGHLGVTQYMEYGTMLHINSMQVMADGRSLLETRGVSRFRVKSSDTLDGYTVGQIERVPDISLAEEEAIEAYETTLPPVPPSDILGQIDRKSTLELLDIGMNFITRMRAASAPWLQQQYLISYGEMPDDPALFPYWFASVLPISEEEKYQLLPTTSVRERLKITAKWVRRIEAQRWFEFTMRHEASDSDDDDVEFDSDGVLEVRLETEEEALEDLDVEDLDEEDEEDYEGVPDLETEGEDLSHPTNPATLADSANPPGSIALPPSSSSPDTAREAAAAETSDDQD